MPLTSEAYSHSAEGNAVEITLGCLLDEDVSVQGSSWTDHTSCDGARVR